MSMQQLLEDFGTTSSDRLVMTDQALEEVRLVSFENGYQAGWEDAAEAHSKEQAHVKNELAQNLQDITFTLHEAETAILRNLEPLFAGLSNTLLPETAQQAFETRISEELAKLIREMGRGRLVLTVNPDQVERVEALAPKDGTVDLSVEADATLGEGQAFLRLGQRERMIDLDSALGEIQQMILSCFGTLKEDKVYG
ncbi:hypothetical protein M8756_07015 [Lutimaribacter sp. EGI FJ00015]|uniref:Uncharacterized protein n=1 Tax=Lutimaribacter degradans TaxID=2945989 RepID=A0ACC5ZUP6_9RHOB|nr:hypothetical protein [Lutimaribacter sp. EGI FJ00013]MCM2561913.1 hypothetical protein [Lutimaribacter sp. EGI FJ00013]MCO0613055.1 hypothetical protein [Lutimaribacter sp. EGI FJ00015]MCO0635745.1 hypothetical protein [Lutimaribacter sp. EGI FJ00014]